MEHISLRVDDSLLEAIDEDRADDVSRSKWLRRAAREKIDRPEASEEIEEVRHGLEELRYDLDDLRDELDDIEEEMNRSLLARIFKSR